MNLNEFHKVNIARQHEAFAPPHSLSALVVCVQEEVGELAGAVLGVTGEKKRKAHMTRADVLDAVADAMTYLSLVAEDGAGGPEAPQKDAGAMSVFSFGGAEHHLTSE